MPLIRALSIIFGFLALGEMIVYLFNIPLPSSIIGLILLFIALQLRWVQVSWLEELSDKFMAHLALFLVPPCVALISHLDLVWQDILPITLSTIFSTFAVLYITAKVHEWLRR